MCANFVFHYNPEPSHLGPVLFINFLLKQKRRKNHKHFSVNITLSQSHISHNRTKHIISYRIAKKKKWRKYQQREKDIILCWRPFQQHLFCYKGKKHIPNFSHLYYIWHDGEVFYLSSLMVLGNLCQAHLSEFIFRLLMFNSEFPQTHNP